MEGENVDFFFDQPPQSKRDRVFEQIQQLGIMIDNQMDLARLQQETINEQKNKIEELEKIIKEQEIKIKEQESIINGGKITTREVNLEPGTDPFWVITDPEAY